MRMPADVNKQPVPVLSPLSATNETMSGTSNPSAAFGAATTVVRLVSSGAINYVLGSAPVATATDTYLPANVVEYIRVSPGEKVAGIGSGILNITECV